MYSRQKILELGARHKKFETMTNKEVLMPGIPFVVRLDGRAFHSFTRRAEKPFDKDLMDLLDETAKSLVAEFKPDIVYTQSDEISMGFKNDDPFAEPEFGGRVSKILSLYAGHATAMFNRHFCYLGLQKDIHKFGSKVPVFDARVIQYPSIDLAAEHFTWREMDATINSINMVAQSKFSNNELLGKNESERRTMLEEAGLPWEAFSAREKRGAYFQKKLVERTLTPEELAKIPEGKRPVGPVIRGAVSLLELPPATEIMNYPDVLFYDESPVTWAELDALVESDNAAFHPDLLAAMEAAVHTK